MEWLIPFGSILLSGIVSFVLTIINKAKMKAEINKIYAEKDSLVVKSALDLVSQLNEQLKNHEREIKLLREEVNNLKKLEVEHGRERIILVEKIEKLQRENAKLKALDIKNSQKIKELREEIDKLKKELEKNKHKEK